MAAKADVYCPALVYFSENFGSIDMSSLKMIAKDFLQS